MTTNIKLNHPRLSVWCGVVWCGVVWCGGEVWCGVVWCGVVWCGVVWCGVVWCGVVWCGVVWCGVDTRALVHDSFFVKRSCKQTSIVADRHCVYVKHDTDRAYGFLHIVTRDVPSRGGTAASEIATLLGAGAQPFWKCLS